jgi:prepilin-type N-terminal cleavage/methylation domain-containing protein
MFHRTRGRDRPPGFTILELLIVIAIVAILVAIAIPALQRQREKSMRTTCVDNLKAMGLAVQGFQSVNNRLPPLYGGSDGDKVQNSAKHSNVWGSTHVFLLPFLDYKALYSSMQSGDQYDPSTFGAPANTEVCSAFVCPADPSMEGGIISGGKFGGTSYAANAQVFAPLAGELLTAKPDGTNGTMYYESRANQFDRNTSIEKLRDGSSNTVIFTHTYALCGSATTGNIWGYSAGINQPPSPIDTFQPWSRASYLGQTYMTTGAVFQNQPNLTKCVITDPATPHADAMMVGLGDGSVRSVKLDVNAYAWNRLCLPNDGVYEGPDDW